MQGDFLTKAQQIVANVEEAQEAMKRIGRPGNSWLNIGFVPSTIYGFLPELLRHYRKSNPKVDITLLEHMSLHQVNALKTGQIDVGFGRLQFKDPAIRQEVVLDEPLVVVLPKAHPLSKKTSIEMEALAGENIILYPRRPRPNYSDHVSSLFYQEGVQPSMVQEVQELQTALGLVASGIGISIVPISVRKMRSDDVIYRPLANPKMTSPVVMMYRDQDPSPVLLNFIKRVRLLAGLTRKKQADLR